MESDKVLFTTRMRKATRDLHAVSDALVNAKLLIALSDHSVWADGLLIFYEIFTFLEKAMEEQKNGHLGELNIRGMSRKEAFECDLNHYLGHNWKSSYEIRQEVALYITHLDSLLKNNPDLLMAYVYHLYMGLLSGGQILRKKRNLENKLFTANNSTIGEAVTDFGTDKISDLKKELKSAMNVIADKLSEEKKCLLIEESKQVFILNNSIIKTVKGANRVILKKLGIFFILAVTIYILIMFLKSK